MPTPEFILRLREHVGHDVLSLNGTTAVILREIDGVAHLLLVRRSDTLAWTPVTGIVDPGEDPARTVVREAREETGVEIEVERLAWVHALPEQTYTNGDRALFLDHCFRCRWVSGEPAVGDDESVETGFFPLDALPEMSDPVLERIAVALEDRTDTRFER